jgi:hypothetical protein
VCLIIPVEEGFGARARRPDIVVEMQVVSVAVARVNLKKKQEIFEYIYIYIYIYSILMVEEFIGKKEAR